MCHLLCLLLVVLAAIFGTEGFTIKESVLATKSQIDGKQKEFFDPKAAAELATDGETKKGVVTEGDVANNHDGCNVCLTTDCVMTAARVLRNIDFTVDPCDNFYDFACGSWSKHHELPDDRANLYAYGILRDNVKHIIKRVLEVEISESDLETIKNAKLLYQSCLNTDLIEERGNSVTFALLREIGGWPLLGEKDGGHWKEEEFDLVSSLVTLVRYNNMPIIAPWVGIDDKDNSMRSLFLDQTWFGLPDRSYYLDESLQEKKEAYRTFAVRVAELMGADSTTATEDVADIVDFETMLANLTVKSEDRRDQEAMYNRMTIKELAATCPEPSEDDPIQFSWLRYLQEVTSIPDAGIELTGDDEVVVVSPAYFGKLFKHLQHYPKRTIANYIVWRFMRNRAYNMPQKYRDEITKYKKALYGTATEASRWKSCASYAVSNFGMAIGRLFVQETFDEKSKTEALDMITNIREVFEEDLDELDWMSEDMREVARQKAQAIVDLVGYPAYILDDDELNEVYKHMEMNKTHYFENVLGILRKASIDNLKNFREAVNESRARWTVAPSTVNAFYSFQGNRITFPAGILQMPYFAMGQPRAMNYGGIGFLMGHEVTHGFDDRGRMYDKDGNLNNWWTDEASEKFKERAKCLIDQYSSFESPDAGVNVNGVTTQGENIADNGGSTQAFRAYRKWVEKRGQEEPLLPGLNMTNNQLFFVNMAQIRCGVSRPEDALNHILTGAHSPNRFRVIGSLQNMQEFADAFRCSNTSYMNPANKCSVW